MRVLITRPEIDAAPFADRLAEYGIDSVVAPLLEIVIEAGTEIDLTGVQGVLFTSANGVRAFAARSAERAIPVFAVGDATAQVARKHGFEIVESAGGDVDDLAALVGRRCRPKDGPLLHIAGSAVAGDLGTALAAGGFTVRRVVAYRAETAVDLPAAARDALAAGTLDAALFFSPRTAATFVSLVIDADLVDSCRTLDAIVLSPAVADMLRELPWRACRIAPAPTADALVSCVVANNDR